MLAILQALLPVFIIIGLGSVLVWRGFLQPDLVKGLNSVAYFIGLPAFLFLRSATGDPFQPEVLPIIGMLYAGSIATIIIAFVIGRLIGVPRFSIAAFVQGSVRGNLAFVGVPIIFYVLADFSPNDVDRVGQMVIFAFVPVTILFNATCTAMLVYFHAERTPDQNVLMITARQLSTNPLVLSSLAGTGWALAKLPLPAVATRSLEVIGQLAMPLALLCIGATLVLVPVRQGLRFAAVASLIKVTVPPAVGWIAAVYMGLPSVYTVAGIILLTTPSAAAGYVLVHQFKADTGLASSIIVISTLISIPAFLITLWLGLR